MRINSLFFKLVVFTLAAGSAHAECGSVYAKVLEDSQASRIRNNVKGAVTAVGSSAFLGASVGNALTAEAVSIIPGAVVGVGVGVVVGLAVWWVLGDQILEDKNIQQSAYNASRVINDAKIGRSLFLRKFWLALQDQQAVGIDFATMVRTITDLDDANSFCTGGNVMNLAGVSALVLQNLEMKQQLKFSY